MQSAAELRRLADALVAKGRYREAAEMYRREAAIYRKNGDVNGAKVEEMKAARWTSDIRLYAHLPDYRPASYRTALSKLEPPYGCALGAFLDRDERLGQPFRANDQRHGDPTKFGELTGKKLASVFCYLSYGRRFPREWVEWLKERNIVPHIAWEPNSGLGSVREDAYLRQFARDLAAADWPVIVRFASEMNGDWTAYGRDPAAYKDAWRLVHRVLNDATDKAVMVWCVNVIPEKPIPSFYPGDEHVDWVGINFYAVPYHDNDINRPGLWENPADNLDFVYRTYASKKPIMICEFGASHLSRVDGKDRSAWAANKINELYSSLPRLYPRVKLIDIFDNDNLTYAMPGRQLNNYSVTDSETVLRGYSRAVGTDYFLSDFEPYRRPTPVVPLIKALSVPRGILRVSSWSRCYSERYAVVHTLDGKNLPPMTDSGAREVELGLSPGPHRLTATLLDDRGRLAARAEARIIAT
ncbi:MAG: glycosyl hydrolase [Capsulimonadales bacterium]|nr:glycosyl hydrolase [Capsulimonadales bacterium]